MNAMKEYGNFLEIKVILTNSLPLAPEKVLVRS